MALYLKIVVGTQSFSVPSFMLVTQSAQFTQNRALISSAICAKLGPVMNVVKLSKAKA